MTRNLTICAIFSCCISFAPLATCSAQTEESATDLAEISQEEDDAVPDDEAKAVALRQERLLWRPLATAGEAAETPLVSMAMSADPAIRTRALEGLSTSTSPEFVPFAIYSLADPSPAVRERALQTLYRADHESVTEAVVAVLAWGDPRVIAAVDRVLPGLRTLLEPGMMRLLDAADTTRDERVAAAYGLGRIASKRAVQALAEKAWGDDPLLSEYAAYAIASVDDPGSLPVLVTLVKHTNPNVRLPAYSGIARIGGPEALSLLTAAASPRGEPNRNVKREVIRYLGLVGDESTVHFLIGLVRARSGFVQPAIDALEVITGMTDGLEAERWLEWYDENFGNRSIEATVAPPPIVPVPERSPIPGIPPGGFPFIP